MLDIVHAPLLRLFPDLVEELGGEPAGLLEGIGLTRDRLNSPRFKATYRQMTDALELAAGELECADFGMRLAKRQNDAMLGPLSQVMKNSRTFGHALDYVIQHTHAHSPAARIWREAYDERQCTFVGHDILLEDGISKRQVMEQILLLGHLRAMDMTGGYARARRVHFRHQPISPIGVYRRFFRCEVEFGQNTNGIFFSDRDLASAVVDPDVDAYQAAAQHIDEMGDERRAPLHAQVRSIILQYLGTEKCTNDQVARELHLHTRTLHRRLAEEGTAFRLVKDEARRDLALYYLQRTRVSLYRISEKLGFAEQSVLTRCCGQWFGASPTQVRLQGSNHPSPCESCLLSDAVKSERK